MPRLVIECRARVCTLALLAINCKYANSHEIPSRMGEFAWFRNLSQADQQRKKTVWACDKIPGMCYNALRKHERTDIY